MLIISWLVSTGQLTILGISHEQSIAHLQSEPSLARTSEPSLAMNVLRQFPIPHFSRSSRAPHLEASDNPYTLQGPPIMGCSNISADQAFPKNAPCLYVFLHDPVANRRVPPTYLCSKCMLFKELLLDSLTQVKPCRYSKKSYPSWIETSLRTVTARWYNSQTQDRWPPIY